MNLEAMQAALREAGFDGWLFYDHHHRDTIAGRILGLDEKAHTTRRWYYFVPGRIMAIFVGRFGRPQSAS